MTANIFKIEHWDARRYDGRRKDLRNELKATKL